MKAHSGLTLIELTIALAITGILSAATFPALRNSFEAARASETRNSLLASLSTASAQASVTGVRAVLCPSEDGTDCLDSADWSKGWIVFLDSNASRDREGGEPLLRVQPLLSGKVHLRTSVGRTRIVFQGNGGNAGSNATFTLCDGRGPSRARSLIMSNAGGLRDDQPNSTAVAAACQP